MPRKILSKIKEHYLRSSHGRNVRLTLDKPIISFTFDDFPISAYKTAGRILEEYDARGTYYTSMGLMGCKADEMEEYFTSKDISEMIEKGHEIGCHTYSHLSGKNTSTDEYIADISRNNEALADIIEGAEVLNFSYPCGHASLNLKQATGSIFKTCRGIYPGINSGSIDLSLLKANKLYSGLNNLNKNLRLIEHNKLSRGWLIFYTHDIRLSPSPWGCTPKYFSDVVSEAVNSGSDILTIKEAYDRLR